MIDLNTPANPENVLILDTTLRDGEQAPGFSMNAQEKARFAHRLELLGVDVIEAGFPVASPDEFESVRRVASQTVRCQVAALARAREEDVSLALRALEPAVAPRLHIFLASSDLHLKHKLHISRSDALKQIERVMQLARGHCDEIQFSAEDASRTEPDYLAEFAGTAAAAGARTFCMPDTVGYSTPSEYARLFEFLCSKLNEFSGVTLSAHCHNDLGLAVANSLAAIGAGARQVECTVNGIGERAGNAALEEVAVALFVRSRYYNVTTNIALKEIYPSSRMLSDICGIHVQPNKAIVGENAFAHESGIHQDGIIKNPMTYEIIEAEKVGAPARRLVLGKHSGRNAFLCRLVELGFDASPAEVERCYELGMASADKQKRITDHDLREIMSLVRQEEGTKRLAKTNSAASFR
jgi:2-isopropylmalate synthase